jgi:hypothetical protein
MFPQYKPMRDEQFIITHITISLQQNSATMNLITDLTPNETAVYMCYIQYALASKPKAGKFP